MERHNHGRHEHVVADFKRRFWVSLALTIPILALSPFIQRLIGLGETFRFSGDSVLLWAFSTAVFVYGGYPFLAGMISEIGRRHPGMMTLIGIATTTAYTYSSTVVFGLSGEVFFWELATLIDVMLLGHWVEMRSVMGASRALEELARLMPSDAHKLEADGSIVDVPLESLVLGDHVLVKPGEKVPADGVVVRGDTSVNEAMLTGESQPVTKTAGDAVIGGSINGEGSLTVEVQKTGADSFLSQVIELVKEAQESKSRTQDIANRAALWLTMIAIGGGGTTLAVWSLLSEQPFSFALERAVTVMVIACPHALGLAVPLVVAVSTALAAGNGLLIRDRVAFEQARIIDAVIFDKTGTLTEGRFGVTDIIILDDRSDETSLLTHAASVESHSEHPIAQAIAASSEHTRPVEQFLAIPGRGAQGMVDGVDVKVVSPGYLREHDITVDDPRIDGLHAQGKTVVFVVLQGSLGGAIALADVIRPESRDTIATLRAMGVKCMMLTGDNQRVAAWVASELGLDDVFAEVVRLGTALFGPRASAWKPRRAEAP